MSITALIITAAVVTLTARTIRSLRRANRALNNALQEPR